VLRRRDITHLGLCCVVCAGCADEVDAVADWRRAVRSGGDHTVADNTRDAYARPSPRLEASRLNAFFVGNSFFNSNWVTAPASAEGRDGLGPTFNAASCSACHFKDGRGRPPLTEDEPFEGLLLRLSVPGVGPHGDPLPEPGYGGQFNHRAIGGVPSEGRAIVRYTERADRFADGTPYTLRVPTVVFASLSFGPLDPSTLFSPRVAPAVFGLGLLEALDDDALLARADPDDRDGDGISGRVNRVWDPALGRVVLGRFGWKANQPSLRVQNAAAFVGDLGITTTVFPAQDCPPVQTLCRAAPHGGEPELDDSKLASVTLYTQSLAVPARRDVDNPTVLRGADLFAAARCTACHTPAMRTADVHPVASLRAQTIHPYTDLLLHDMGPGLADHRPDFEATGTEWRTPPLWGLGLLERVNRHTFLLHDGRARDVTEAILWHGGEAASAQAAFVAMPAADRAALVAFLHSL